MKFSPLALLLSANSLLFAGAALHSNEKCPPRPEPIRDIKFTDLGGDSIHNYELHGNARIVEPAPGEVPRALRIDTLFSFALLKDLDISPSNMKDMSFSIGVYIESIKPAIAGAPDPQQKEAYGWVMSHDNGGYDRAIFLHDERFNGIGITSGTKIPANTEYTIPPLKKWIQIIGVWRQDGECDMYIDSVKHTFSQPIIGKNNDGLKDVAIGAPQAKRYGKENDNDVWVKDVKVFDFALDEEQIDAMKCNFDEDLKPNIDCGVGGDLVFSCTECPNGTGASGCEGDCMWNNDLGACVDDDVYDDVSCGDHDAPICSQCDLSKGETACSGDCKFADGECRPIDWEPTEPEPPACTVNVALSALGGVASQSSNYHDGGAASLAIDGSAGVNWGDRTMSHTSSNSKKPWWKVKFRKTDISSVYIVNRKDCCSDRMTGLIMEIFDGGKQVYSSAVSAIEESSTAKAQYKYNIPNIMGDTVKIRLEKNTPLHMAEVYVMGCFEPEPPVDCGDHEAASCGQCTLSGGGAIGCAGDCVWNPKVGKCIEDNGNDISCGSHDAADCSQCDLSNGLFGCSGECKFADGACRPIDWEPPMVDCGDHEAASCRECPDGQGLKFQTVAHGCQGECMWDHSTRTCIEDNGNDLSCGDHDAASCDKCPTKLGAVGCAGDCLWNPMSKKCVDGNPGDVLCGSHRASVCGDCANGKPGCQGDCKWHDASNRCVPIDWVPPPSSINCGYGKFARSCDKCVVGGSPAGCAGQCAWSRSSRNCIPKPPGGIFQCGDHQASSCGQCGVSPNIRLTGMYYTNTYQPDAHEILNVGGPFGAVQRYDLKKMRGDRHVPKNAISIQVWTNGSAAVKSRIRKHAIKNVTLRNKYCASAHPSHPAQIQVAGIGYTRRSWVPGYVILFSQTQFIFISTDNKFQMPFTRATEAQKRQWIR